LKKQKAVPLLADGFVLGILAPPFQSTLFYDSRWFPTWDRDIILLPAILIFFL
jgi:hypothetical protein